MWHDLVGKEFEYNAKGPDKYDCYHLCREVYRRIGIELPEYSSPSEASLIHQMIIQGKDLFIEIESPEPYCLIALMIKPPYISHIGVVLNPPYFLHIMQKRLSVIERLDSTNWQRRIKGYYKWKN